MKYTIAFWKREYQSRYGKGKRRDFQIALEDFWDDGGDNK